MMMIMMMMMMMMMMMFPKNLKQRLKIIGVTVKVKLFQKAALLGTGRLLRKVLEA